MRVRSHVVVLRRSLLVVAVTAATAGARVSRAQKTTTITFWDAYSSAAPEVKRLEKVVIPRLREDAIRGSS